MSARVKKILKISIPFLLGFILLYYIYQKTSPGERDAIIENMASTDPLWVCLSILIGILSHISRALRWNYLLKPMGYAPNVRTNFFAIMIGYLANLGVPRSGEFLRATTLATYENVPFEKGFGTIVTERIVDVVMLLLIITVALMLQTTFIMGYLNDYGMGLVLSILALAVGIVGLAVFLRLVNRARSGFLLKVKTFLNGMLQGVSSILKMKYRLPFIFHTLFIWTCYIGMFWVLKFAFAETGDLGATGLLVAFVAGAFAMMVFPGGFVGYPVFVAAALSLYGVSKETGDAFGWVMWISQTAMVVVLGAISFILLPLFRQTG